MFLFFQAAKEAKARIPPWKMFKHETDKYSKFDEQVRVPILGTLIPLWCSSAIWVRATVSKFMSKL